MVLKHVPHNAGLVIVTAAIFHSHGFRRGNLDVVDVAPVPDRLENGVGETENHDILHRLFAEIVIDSVNLLLIQHFMHSAVEFPGRLEIRAKGLLDDHSSARLTVAFPGRQSDRRNLLDDRAVQLRRRRQVENPHGRDAAAAVESVDKFLESPGSPPDPRSFLGHNREWRRTAAKPIHP